MSLIGFLVVLLAFIGLNAYLFIRGRQALPDGTMIHTTFTIVFLFFAMAVFIPIFAGSKLPNWLSFIFEQVGGYYIILFIFFIAAALLGDLLRLTDYFFHVFPAWLSANFPLARLYYFSTVILFMIILSLIGYNRFSNPNIVEFDLPASPETGNSAELSILVISDLHLGNVIRKGRLVKWVDIINRKW